MSETILSVISGKIFPFHKSHVDDVATNIFYQTLMTVPQTRVAMEECASIWLMDFGVSALLTGRVLGANSVSELTAEQ